MRTLDAGAASTRQPRCFPAGLPSNSRANIGILLANDLQTGPACHACGFVHLVGFDQGADGCGWDGAPVAWLDYRYRSRRDRNWSSYEAAGEPTTDHLGRSAIVYVRQLTVYQVATNTESGRRQFGLVERECTGSAEGGEPNGSQNISLKVRAFDKFDLDPFLALDPKG